MCLTSILIFSTVTNTCSKYNMERARELLRRAVESLEEGSGRTTETTSSSNESPSAVRLEERNRLFNFGHTCKRRSGGRGGEPPRARRRVAERMWVHDFICLSRTSATRPPTSMEAGELLRAGLGRKQLSMSEGASVHDELMTAFPLLSNGGGYELLRVDTEDRGSLIVIPPPYTVSYLKEVLRQAKVYVRPMQRDLPLAPVLVQPHQNGPIQECLTCGMEVPLGQLRSHLDNCEVEMLSPADGSSEDDLPPVISTALRVDERSSDEDTCTRLEEDIMEAVRVESLATCTRRPGTSSFSETDQVTLEEVISELKQRTVRLQTCHLHVRRDFIITDLLTEARKPSFDPHKKIKTWFVGEAGVDAGGLTRELWRLFAAEVRLLCDGNEDCKVPRHDADKLQQGTFITLGTLMGISLIQKGSGFPFFAPSVYSYISGQGLQSITVAQEEIPHADTRAALLKICNASEETLHESIMEEYGMLQACGYRKPVTTLKPSDISHLVQSVALHTTILAVKAELDQIVEGLAKAGVLESIRKHPNLFKPLFVYQPEPITAGAILALFHIKRFSDPGTADLRKEQATYILFKNLLEEMERGDIPIPLSECLVFFTGTDRIIDSYLENGVLEFSSTNSHPTASTCVPQLTLPTKHHNDYGQFKEEMCHAFTYHGGFGLC